MTPYSEKLSTIAGATGGAGEPFPLLGCHLPRAARRPAAERSAGLVWRQRFRAMDWAALFFFFGILPSHGSMRMQYSNFT